MNDIRPIKPSEVVNQKIKDMPDFVIKAFNELIAFHWNGTYSRVTLEEAREKLVTSTIASKKYGDEINMDTRKLITTWLDIEDIYRKEGWKVVYDSPGYNETYDATYTFSKK